MGILYLHKSPPPSVFSRFLLHKIAMTWGFWLLLIQSCSWHPCHRLKTTSFLSLALSERFVLYQVFVFFRHLCIEFNWTLWHIFWGEKIHQKSKNTKKTSKPELSNMSDCEMVSWYLIFILSMAMFYFLISNYWLI